MDQRLRWLQARLSPGVLGQGVDVAVVYDWQADIIQIHVTDDSDHATQIDGRIAALDLVEKAKTLIASEYVALNGVNPGERPLDGITEIVADVALMNQSRLKCRGMFTTTRLLCSE